MCEWTPVGRAPLSRLKRGTVSLKGSLNHRRDVLHVNPGHVPLAIQQQTLYTADYCITVSCFKRVLDAHVIVRQHDMNYYTRSGHLNRLPGDNGDFWIQ